MRPWLILCNVASEGPGLLGEVLTEERIPYETVDPFSAESLPATAHRLGGLVILGGPMGVYESARYPVLGHEGHLARQATDLGRPVLGICLGAQLLAHAFGAAVYPGPSKEIGWAPVTLTPDGRADPVLCSLARAAVVFHLHGDTFDRPAGSVHLARSDQYEMQAFRIGQRAYGLQFHLEFTAPTVDLLLQDPKCHADLQALGRSPEGIRRESVAQVRSLEPVARQIFRTFVRLLP